MKKIIYLAIGLATLGLLSLQSFSETHENDQNNSPGSFSLQDGQDMQKALLVEELKCLSKDLTEVRKEMFKADVERKQWDRMMAQPLTEQIKSISDPFIAVLAEEVLISESALETAKKKESECEIESAQSELEKSKRKLKAALRAMQNKNQSTYAIVKAKCETLEKALQQANQKMGDIK